MEVDMETSRDAFRELTEEATIDLAAALDDIQGSSGFKAILTVMERLEADSALRLARASGEEIPRLQGAIVALQDLRARLNEVHVAGHALALDRAENGSGRELERFGSLELAQRRQDAEDEAQDAEAIPVPPDLADFTRPGGGHFG